VPKVRLVRYTIWAWGYKSLNDRWLIHVGPWDVIVDWPRS
jgi:hypothetical protein